MEITARQIEDGAEVLFQEQYAGADWTQQNEEYKQTFRNRFMAAVQSAFPAAPVAATHRHKKRGSQYTLLGIGKMQAENWEVREYCSADEPVAGVSVDMEEVAVYRSTDDGSLWVRPLAEFDDGRFEAVAA